MLGPVRRLRRNHARTVPTGPTARRRRGRNPAAGGDPVRDGVRRRQRVAQPVGASPASSTGKVVLTVGMTEDIDSANPFTGIAAVSYEIFQMEYPTLTEYDAGDFHIVPGLAESWQESADHTTWTYKIRSGLTWSDGVPLTAKDAAYTFNRVINGQYERTNYGSYVDNITKAAAPDDTTLVLTVKKPSPIMEKLLVYILPEHIWKSIDEKAVKSYTNEGTPASPTVGSGPFTMVERKVGQFIRMQANPSFYRGKPAVDEVVFKIYKNQDALGQALKKGEIDFADSLECQRLQVAARTSPASRRCRRRTPASTSSRSTPVRRSTTARRSATATRCSRTRRCARRSAGPSTARRMVDKVLGGGGIAGTTIIPSMYASLHLDPANPLHLRPGEGEDAARRRRLQGRRRRHPRRLEGQPALVPALRPHRLLGQQLAEGRAVPQGLLPGRRRRGHDQDDRERQPHDAHRRGQVRHVRVGLGRRARPELPAVDLHLREPVRTRTATRSTPTCRTRSTATRPTTRCTPSRASRPTSRSAPTSSSRCSRCSTTTRRTSSPTTTTTPRPTARTASPAS